MARSALLIFFGGLFAAGLYPPDHPWLMGLGLVGFILALFVPKDF